MKKTPVISEQHTITVGNSHIVSYTLFRKPIKNLYLRIHSDCSITVSAPAGINMTEIEAFLMSRAAYIMTVTEKLQQRADNALPDITYIDGDRLMLLGYIRTLRIFRSNVNKAKLSGDNINVYAKDPADITTIKSILDKWKRSESKRIFKLLLSEALSEFSSLYPHTPEITVRRMKSRWGSCHVNSNRITLNERLIEAPAECIRFVILHELCHFIHPNHSSSFYRLLEAFCPYWKKTKKLLEDSVIL